MRLFTNSVHCGNLPQSMFTSILDLKVSYSSHVWCKLRVFWIWNGNIIHVWGGTGKKERFLSKKESVPKDWPGCHEIKMTGDAGRVCIIDFDIWHRGSANISNINRYMLKMQFIRNVEPDTPSWDCKTNDWLLDEIDSSRKHLVLDSWHWMLGESGNGLSLPTSEIPFDELQRDMFNDKASNHLINWLLIQK